MNSVQEIPLYVLHYCTFLCQPLLIDWRLRLPYRFSLFAGSLSQGVFSTMLCSIVRPQLNLQVFPNAYD